MRISDWSSDVCSSDLVDLHERALHGRAGRISGPHIHAIEATPDPHHRSNPQHAAQTAVTALAHGRRMTTPLSSPPGGDRIAVIGLGYVGLPLAVALPRRFACVGIEDRKSAVVGKRW